MVGTQKAEPEFNTSLWFNDKAISRLEGGETSKGQNQRKSQTKKVNPEGGGKNRKSSETDKDSMSKKCTGLINKTWDEL